MSKLHVYEFEVFEDEGMFTAIPYDLPFGTSGKDYTEVCEYAADILQTCMEHRDMYDEGFPEPTFGNTPRHESGQNIIIAVKAGKDTVERVTAAEAARRLGVTPGRVSQMVKAAVLESFELDGRTWITEDSINARLAEKPKAGRPRKKKSAESKQSMLLASS